MAGAQSYPAWVHSPEQTAAHHGVNLDVGLTSSQVEDQRRRYGWNELEKTPGKPLWKLVLEQFDDMLVKVYINSLTSSLLFWKLPTAEAMQCCSRLKGWWQCRCCCWQPWFPSS